jgi:hypothetical protein
MKRFSEINEDLRKWFSKTDPEGDWKRVNTKGEVVGDCAREPGEPKPKCMSQGQRASLSKKEKSSAVRRKREQDPNAERQGSPINVTNKVNENMEKLDEKNKPTNPELWSKAIAQAKSKFDVYPSAYANGYASKWYKSKGGGWKTVSEAKEKSEYDYEGDMARGQLQSIINNAQKVHDMLKDNDNLPEWVQSKITLAEDYISTVANYMMSEVDEEVVVEEKGLWANIRAKRERIKNGSGESMRKPGSEGAPSEEILKKTQAVKEEVKGEYERKVDTYLKKKYGKDKSQKKLPQGAEFAAARRKARLASNGRMDEGKMDKLSLSNLWHKHAEHSYAADQGFDHGSNSMRLNQHAAKAIEKHVTKKHGSQVSKDMISHSDTQTAHSEYLSGKEAKDALKDAAQLRKKHGIQSEETEQIEEGRPSQQHPIEGHEYHKKSDAELRYILKDAGTAAKAMKDHSPRAESKYLDQVNDASTVLSFRQRNGTPAWYKKKYDHVKEDVVTEGYFSDMDADNKDKQYAGTKAYHANKNAKKAMDPPFTPDAPKKNLGVVVGKRPEGMSKARHLARLAMKGELNKKKTVKEDNAPDVEKTNTPAKRTVSKTTMIVKDAAKSSKEKNKDKFEAEPELSSQIVRNNF